MAVEFDRLNITSGYNVSKINTNFQRIDEALQDAVSRSGDGGPNQMGSDLDMNGNDILNVTSLDTSALFIDGNPIVVTELDTLGPNTVGAAQIIDGSISDDEIAADAGIADTKVAHTNTGTGGVTVSVYDKLDGVIDVREFGAVGDGTADDTTALQNAFNYAKLVDRWVYLPSGDYRITASLTFDRTADGQSSPGLKLFGDGMYASTIVNRIVAGGPSIDMTAGGAAIYMQGGHIRDLGFTQVGSGADSHGIRYRSCWHQTFENLRFFELNGSGLKSVNTSADADASAHVDFIHVRAHGCQGPGIDNNNGSGGLALHRLLNCEIGDCGKNGTACLVLDGNIQFSADMCSFASSDTAFPLVHIKSTNVRTRQIRFSGGEYGNNSGTHFDLDAVSSFEVDGIRQVRRAAEPNSTIGFDFADGVSLFSGITIRNIELQIDDATPVWTWVKMGTGMDSAGACVIEAPNASNFASGNVLFSYTSTAAKDKNFTVENEGGKTILGRPALRTRVVYSTPGNITVDLTTGSWHQANITAAGVYTVQAPSGGVTDGREWILTIFKDGTVTVNFAASIEAPTVPTTGATYKWMYDAASTFWRRIQ